MIEVLEFWQEKINFNRELDFRETEKIKFYQKFLFFIRDKTMSNFIVNIHFGQKTNKAKKKQVVLIELLLQTCDLLNFFKNKNLLFFTIENENKIAEILKKIKKEEPCRLKITRWWKKIKLFLIEYPTQLFIFVTFILNIIGIVLSIVL